MSAQAEFAASPTRRFGIVRLGQPAAITLAVLVICAVMALISEPFRSYDNLYNDSRNFGFVAIMGMGQMLVIITGGIDLSVGSVMGLVGIVTGLTLQAGYPLVDRASAQAWGSLSSAASSTAMRSPGSSCRRSS